MVQIYIEEEIMYEGHIMVDILHAENREITRAIKQFKLPFQPYEGMRFDTGLGSYKIDSIEWSLEHMSFYAQVYLVMTEHSIDYDNEFVSSGWEMSKVQPVDGYIDHFLQEHLSSVVQVIACDACGGTGKGGYVQSMLGPAQSACERCMGLKKIKRALQSK